MTPIKNNDSFALDLSSLIIHLEYQRKRVLENPYTKERMCFCRSLIMNRYTSTLQKFLIRLSSRTLKFLDDYNYAITTDMTDLREWFYSEIYDVLYEDPEISNKMVLLFRTVQENLDKQFFNIIDSKYRDIIRSHDLDTLDEFSNILEGLYSEVRSWFEVFVYNILAVQLNCENISDQIFEDYDVPNDLMSCHADELRDPSICSTCPFNACRGCHVHEGVVDKGENIIIVMTDELIGCPSWLSNVFQIVQSYHKNPHVVKFAFDFRMYDYANKFYFSKVLRDHVKTAVELFGKENVIITNYEGVEFNLFQPYIEEFLD